MNRWYVVATHPRAEALARTNLLRQGFEAWFPRYRKSRRHARKVDIVAAPLFPSYLFVSLDAATARWRSINGTIGCRQVVATGDRPMPVPAGVVEALQAEADGDGFIEVRPPVNTFAPDTPLRIVEGPMTDLVGRFQSLDDAERVVLLLDLLGRSVRVQVPLGAVEAL